ncbi:MAG: shikimate kinase [Cyclobacteriaceae bacterium]|nr:shikimate kinase [Cyclobacteriaceae bacterium SS2]
MSSYRKVFLVGMPGSGKSYQANQLSDRLNLPFIDLDEEIIKTIHMSISDYFASQGEEAFRIVERDVLKKTIDNNSEFVMATGGGTPCFYENIDLMNSSGLTVFLDTPRETLLERIKLSKSRPLMQNDPEKKLSELFESRYEIYNKSKLRTSDPQPEALTQLIKDYFKS